jgi:serine/threonine-protein kinase
VGTTPALLRARQKLGKYRILGRISSGPLADVYSAFDTIHKSRVALKIPRVHRNITHEDFLREVQVAVKLRHPNILSVQNASYIDGHFVIAMELGEESLADRLFRRISTERALELADQALAGLAFAHSQNVIHCDIKPENYILFADDTLKLTDFGFAKISLRTLKASGSGTIDYIAPEQAMGRPKFQSDVFSCGLVLYRMFSGKLPEWPFAWPLPGHERVSARVRPAFVEFLKKAIQLDPADRWRDALQMYSAFRRVRSRARRPRRRTARSKKPSFSWRQQQWREFQRLYKSVLDTRHQCRRCEGPVAESMHACPWCGVQHPTRGGQTTLPAQCPRCERGVKRDWNYCSWCYGPGFEPETNRRYSDRRYVAKCANTRCRRPLMAFMRYCPWCRTKVKKPWKLAGSRDTCPNCRWGIAKDFWNFCAWCSEAVTPK